MIGHSAKSKKHFYYLCSRSNKQGKDACDAPMLVKRKLEKQVIDQLKARVLTDENLEKMVRVVNEDLMSASDVLKDQLDVIDAEMKDVRARLSRLYDALETGKLGLDELSPRLKELKARQDELGKSRVQVEVDIVAEGVEQIEVSAVKAYARDMRAMLDEADFTKSKAFLRTFVKRIEMDGKDVRVCYRLPLPPDGRFEDRVPVLPIDTPGGAEWTERRTFKLAFSLTH